MSEENYYELLDVPPDAPADEIREAIAAQRRHWHPLVNNWNEEVEEEARRKLRKLVQADEVLLDPARRASYDETLRRASRQVRHQPASPTPSPGDRAPNWPCPECGRVSPHGSKVCTQCGAVLTKVCPHCRSSMYVADRFCGECASNYEEVRARYEKVAVQAAVEAEEAVQAAQQAKGKRDVEAAKRAAGQAEAAVGRAQDAAARAGTRRARDAASTAGGAARSAEEVVQQAKALLEEQARRRQEVVSVLKLAGAGVVLLVLAQLGLFSFFTDRSWGLNASFGTIRPETYISNEMSDRTANSLLSLRNPKSLQGIVNYFTDDEGDFIPREQWSDTMVPGFQDITLEEYAGVRLAAWEALKTREGRERLRKMIDGLPQSDSFKRNHRNILNIFEAYGASTERLTDEQITRLLCFGEAG